MAAQLGELAVGSIVKLNVGGTGTNFIVVNQGIPQNSSLYDPSCNGTWLLMQAIYAERFWDEEDVNDYEMSDIHNWLNAPSGFFGLLDVGIQQAISNVKIPYRPGSGTTTAVNTGADGLPCKVFLLGGCEMGWTTSDNSVFSVKDGAKLEYFLSGTASSANSQRVAAFNALAGIWTLRTPWWERSTHILSVMDDGNWGRSWVSFENGVRPALILPFDCLVDDNNFIIANQSPAAPSGLTVPDTVPGGGELLVSWAAASDPDGDPVSYELERKTDAADWAQIYQGEALSFTDQITKGWLTVQYRVRAVDSGNLSSGWTESETRTVDNNADPVIACEHPDGGDLGEKAEPFAVNYTLTDPDGDPLTLTETVDGQTTRTETQAESGAAFEAAVLGDPAEFQKLLNGPHTLSITASDGKARTTHTLTFTKKVTSASVTLSEPLAVEGDITLAALRVAGSIPADALFTVEVTNNGADDQPVWQDATAEVKRGANIVFENHAAAKGAAFNFRLSVSRGPSGQGGYITAITGAFQ